MEEEEEADGFMRAENGSRIPKNLKIFERYALGEKIFFILRKGGD